MENSLNIYNRTYEPGDYVEFEKYIPTDYGYEYLLCKGRILDCQDQNLFETEIISKYGKSNKIKKGNIYWINPLSIKRHYPSSLIDKLSLRIVLKERWQKLIFREVKVIKTKDLEYTTYTYINESGFIRTEKYDPSSVIIAAPNQNNIQYHYQDYFGFTTNRSVRDNDMYDGQEIFFSRKCYSELDLNISNITATFSSKRGYKSSPPKEREYICGLVESGEKGLFYRKWFVCSKEFLLLWTMICNSDHYSLKKKINGSYKYIVKSIPEILSELDTKKYNVTHLSDLSVKEKQKLFQVHNIENIAIYDPDVYKNIVKAVFCRNNNESREELYEPYIQKFRKEILWMKCLTP